MITVADWLELALEAWQREQARTPVNQRQTLDETKVRTLIRNLRQADDVTHSALNSDLLGPIRFPTEQLLTCHEFAGLWGRGARQAQRLAAGHLIPTMTRGSKIWIPETAKWPDDRRTKA